MYNIKMRLTRFTVVAASTTLIGLILLMETSSTSAFRLEAKGDSTSKNTINSKGPVHSLVSSSSSLSAAASSLSSPGQSGVSSVSKRSLSSSSSSSLQSEPSFRHHENSILSHVAWPGKGMWGFLPSSPSDKKIVAASVLQSQSSPSLSSSSSFNKKASSLASERSFSSKKKSAPSDLFLDPVNLDDDAPSFFSHHLRPASITSGGAPNNFFHSSSSLSEGASGGGSGVADGNAVHATPPPRPHYILLQPPTRIEQALENELEAEGDLMENEVLDTADGDDLLQHEGDEHPNWATHLKRSSPPGVVTRSSSDLNKRTRSYDIPQVECPPAEDGMERFACPSADRVGRYRCIDDHVLCDGFIDCPGKEDEDLQACMFYKTTKAHLDVLADALLRWARGKR